MIIKITEKFRKSINTIIEYILFTQKRIQKVHSRCFFLVVAFFYIVGFKNETSCCCHGFADVETCCE